VPESTLASDGAVAMHNLDVLKNQVLTVGAHPRYAAPLRALASHIADLITAVGYLYDRQVAAVGVAPADAPQSPK
jgi:hypothetical protein